MTKHNENISCCGDLEIGKFWSVVKQIQVFFGKLTNLEVSGKSKENLIFGGASDISILGKVQELQDVSLMEWWRETAERFGAE